MHKAWPRLLRRMNANKVDLMEDKHLVSCSRTWFCLYLFEHQFVAAFDQFTAFADASPGYLMEQAGLLS